jgi:hypothetical protein
VGCDGLCDAHLVDVAPVDRLATGWPKDQRSFGALAAARLDWRELLNKKYSRIVISRMETSPHWMKRLT